MQKSKFETYHPLMQDLYLQELKEERFSKNLRALMFVSVFMFFFLTLTSVYVNIRNNKEYLDYQDSKRISPDELDYEEKTILVELVQK